MRAKKSVIHVLAAAMMVFLSVPPALAASSDFIEDLPQLSADKQRPGGMIWEKPGVNRANYTRVMIEPITIFISPDSPYKGMSPAELKALSDKFQEVVLKTLEPDVPVVSQPGPGVVYLRPALVDVSLAKKKRGLLGYTPVGLVVVAVADAAGARISLKEARLEVEALDSVSGERVAVIIDNAPKSTESEQLSWSSIEKTFAFYAERFKSRLKVAQQ